VLPLLKSNSADTNTLSNYRPVANLPFLSKIVEKIVAEHLVNLLNSNRCFDPHQSGYRRFYSCETAIAYLMNAIFTGMDNGRVTLLILLDLSSAFDCVDHRILINKLELVGVSGSALKWFSNYLSSRYQSTVITSTVSPPLPLKRGVPQGSVLGPLLFSTYFSGFREIILRYGFDYVIYADDVQLFQTIPPDGLKDCCSRAEACIDELRKYFTSLKLSLNVKKTEVILLGTKKACDRCQFSGIMVNGNLVEPSTTVRTLGVMLDQHLTMESHVNKIRRSAFANLRLIARSKKCLSRDTTILLAHSFILSHLNYCVSLLVGINQTLISKLQLIINSTMRMICGLRKHQSVDNAIEQHGWLSVDQIIQRRILSIVLQVLEYGEPEYLRQYINQYIPRRVS
jgi:hypothetical protein